MINQDKRRGGELPESSKYRWDYFPPEKVGYLRLSNLEIHRTLPLVEGEVMLDIGKNGEIIGIEILL